MAANPFAQAAEYSVDLVYPSSFVLGQTPLQMQWVAVTAGATPGPLTRVFRYCDLGCGDGSTLCLLAACYPRAEFVGIDINPSHIALARDRASRAGLGNVSFLQTSFASLGAQDFPPFDYIVAYGVYSWLDADLQASVATFAQQKLGSGGLLGLHYSSLPGSTVRDPLSFYLRALGTAESGDSAAGFATGLAALRKLAPVSRFFEQNPQAQTLLDSVGKAAPEFVAHDILNRQLHSFYSPEMHARLAALGLAYFGSANVLPDYPELLLARSAFTAYEQLTTNSDVAFREAVRDFMLNTDLRFDLFRKPGEGARIRGERLHQLGHLYLQRAGTRQDLESRRRWSGGCAVDLTAGIYSTVLDLASAPAVTLGDVLRSPDLKAIAAPAVEQTIEHLFALGLLNILVERPIEAEYRSDRRYRLKSAVNAQRLEETLRSPAPEGLASTVLGSPLLVPASARLQLMALLDGHVDRTWEAGGGAARSSLEQFREWVRANLPRFVVDGLPQLLRLGVIEEDR